MFRQISAIALVVLAAAGPMQMPKKPGRVLVFVLLVVLINGGLIIHNGVRNWPELTLAHHVVGILFGLLLPFFAVVLLWRSRGEGRWILIGLFGLHALGDLLILVMSPVFRVPSMLLVEPCRTLVLKLLFYSAATAWFFASPSMRQLSRKRQG
jgi:hypothetical protein